MTLGQLKEAVEYLLANGASADAEVFAEGCDCSGEARGLALEHNGRVELRRGHTDFGDQAEPTVCNRDERDLARWEEPSVP